ncbi:hypothetical protein GWI33_007500 [Rhynchophorus ferrugineus]|uniref:Transposase n=1 Tax=Rhynchophorus ferrugineus TaxID=354439 RepID=A0A834IJS9_RHYFE|nr:hypothetical protein GWI33_007500 [Rhynchophorus ferrugineus]
MMWYSSWKHHLSLFFFENDQAIAVTVTSEWYQDMIRNFLVPEMEDQRLENMWFQQDGATVHTARSTIQLLNDIFPRRLISPTLQDAMKNALKRAESCIANRGRRLADIIFQS